MDISVSRLLINGGCTLREAKKVSSEAKIRERAYAIKAICELISRRKHLFREVQMNRPLRNE